MTNPLKRSLGEILADKLRGEIEAGKWTTFLPSEIKLSNEYKVARKTLRNALAILTTEGYLSQPSRGRQRELLKGVHVDAKELSKVGILTALPISELKSSMQGYLRELRQRLEASQIVAEFGSIAFQDGRVCSDALERHIVMTKADIWLVVEGSNQVIKALQETAKPVFAIGGSTEIMKESYSVAYEIVSAISHAYHLLKRRGHSYFVYPFKTKKSHETHLLNVISTDMEKRGVNASEVESFLTFYEPGRESYYRFLTALFRKPNKPTALITGNDNVVSTITWLASQGLRVPDDVSILNIGADDILNDVYPKLDVYATPGKKLAIETTKMIEKVLDGTLKQPCRNYLDCEYIAGDSLKTIE